MGPGLQSSLITCSILKFPTLCISSLQCRSFDIYIYIHIYYIYRIARNFQGLKCSRIGLPENFCDFIFADGRFDLMTY